MLHKIKKSSLGLSLVAILALSPLSLSAASGSGMMEGSSESTSALMEDPAFEKQLNRINVGINLIRINTDILENMPVSEDSKWVDEVIAPYTAERGRFITNMDEVKNDAYYSTAALTDAILGKRQSLVMSPLIMRLYSEAAIIYKNSSNGNPDFHIPDMNVFPDITDTKTYVTFKADDKVALINVEAVNGNLYKNVEEATISLLPEDLQEGVQLAKDEYKVAFEDNANAKSTIEALKAWLDDDKNENSPEKETKAAELEAAEADQTAKEEVMNAKQEAYFALLEQGATAVESNFNPDKVNLAKKLESLLDAIDNNAFGAASMFTSASAGLARGYGMISKEMEAIQKAQALTQLVGNQKMFLTERYTRMATGTLLALPNIFIGTYYAASQSSKIGKYQDIVKATLAGAQAAQEAAQATKEAQEGEN
jgi:hypothetical protein